MSRSSPASAVPAVRRAHARPATRRNSRTSRSGGTQSTSRRSGGRSRAPLDRRRSRLWAAALALVVVVLPLSWAGRRQLRGRLACCDRTRPEERPPARPIDCLARSLRRHHAPAHPSCRAAAGGQAAADGTEGSPGQAGPDRGRRTGHVPYGHDLWPRPPASGGQAASLPRTGGERTAVRPGDHRRRDPSHAQRSPQLDRFGPVADATGRRRSTGRLHRSGRDAADHRSADAPRC